MIFFNGVNINFVNSKWTYLFLLFCVETPVFSDCNNGGIFIVLRTTGEVNAVGRIGRMQMR